MNTEFDALVVGSGVAGATATLHLARRGLQVGLITKGALGVSTTEWAQGGIAAVLGESDDDVELHYEDTLRAGAGLCDPETTRILVEEGPARVRELVGIGALLDREADGTFALSREGGHSRARVVHAGGAATGAEVVRALVAALRAAPVTLFAHHFACDLSLEAGRCAGVTVREPTGGHRILRAGAVVLATGGSGQAFDVTTNPAGATGDGVAMALRAGVAVADLEFVQFHPTALDAKLWPRPLLSEALRGHGALLLDGSGQRFVDELAPRDVVSRAIARAMAEEGGDHVYLDARPIERFAARFPALASTLADAGLDAARDLLPVAPAAHYQCGGILVDAHGASALAGLYAVGEVACSGVHGANRLASNSLLDGLVFGARAADAIAAGRDGPERTGPIAPLLDRAATGHLPVVRLEPPQPLEPAVPAPAPVHGALDAARAALQRAMSARAGVVRDGAGLARLVDDLAEAAGHAGGDEPEARELANLVRFGSVLVAAASARAESRGAHTRADYPERDDRLACRLVVAPGAPGAGGASRGA